MKRILLIIAIILQAFFIFSHSVPAVTLEECKILALQNSKLLAAYENLIQTAISANRKDKSALLPQISGFYQPDYVQYGDKVDFPRHGTRTHLGLGFSLDIPKILSDYPQLSNLEIEKSKLIRQIAENEILKQVTQDYYLIYIYLKKKCYYAGAQTYINGHIKDIDNLQSKGVDVKLDLIRARMQLRSLYLSLSNLDTDIANAFVSLNSMMNTEYKEADFNAPDKQEHPDRQTALAGNNPNSDMDAAVAADLDASSIEHVKKALHLSGLEQSKLDELDVSVAGEKYRQSLYNYLPSLDGGYEHNAHTIDPSVEEDRMFLTLSINIFDFGQRANERRQLKYSYESERSLFLENQRKLKVQIDQLITQLENIQTIYKGATENLTSAEKALDTAKDYYQQGKIKETDLLSIFSEYMNAKDQNYDILYNFFSKKAELDSLTRGM